MEFVLALEFDRDSVDFARGVQVGMLWAAVQSGPLPVDGTIHADSIEMAMRIADANGVSVRACDSDGDWLNVTFY